MIGKSKWQQLKQWMLKLAITEDQLEEKFIIGSGRGGQKLHKSATCVWIKHQPTGTVIKCQETRSREDNRYFARKRLCEKIDNQQQQEKSQQQQAIEKIRRQKKRRSRRAKQRLLDDKRHQANLKKTRQKPDDDNH